MPPLVRFTPLALASSTPRSSHTVAISNNGLIALYGGELVPRVPVDARDPSATSNDDAPRASVHVFDLKAHLSQPPSADKDAFRTLEPLQDEHTPEPRVGATAVFADDGALYLWGGRGGPAMAPLPAPQAGVWRGTLGGGRVAWARVPALDERAAPEPRSYHAALIHANKLYIHAGCPATGRLNTLHAFDLRTHAWTALAPAPGPARGGTVLAATTLRDGRALFVRFGGFAGYELPTPDAAGSIDVYDPAADAWRTLVPAPDPAHGMPGARSVHGLVGLRAGDAVALLWHGEREASALGHTGAGAFWGDAWVLECTGEDEWRWRRAEALGAQGLPEARGWFPPAAWVEEGTGKVRAVMQGGLVESNARKGDLWMLEVVQVGQ